MALEIKNSINWQLHFPNDDIGENGTLIFEQSLFSNVNRDSEDVFNSNSLSLFDIIQEAYYVNQFDFLIDRDENEEIDPNSFTLSKSLLDRKDIAWDSLRYAFSDLFHKIYNNFDLLISDDTFEDRDSLFNRKGQAYSDFIRYVMRGVYLLRYEVYSSLKGLIPWALRRKYNVARCTDIVCNGADFQKFFNLSINWIEDKQNELQTNEGKDLESLIQYLSNRFGGRKFKKKYAKGVGCFSKTLVRKNDNSYADVLCFSGDPDPIDQLKVQIDKIAYSGYFQNPYVVKVTSGIKYFLSSSDFITHGEAIASGLYNPDKSARMFSCCERKTFADYDLGNCLAFRMVVKYAPCVMCVPEVNIYDNGHNKRVIAGRPIKEPSRLKEYNELANKIYRKIHPLLLPCYPIPSI